MEPSNRGMTLVELLIALGVLAIGILAIGRLFPLSSSTQNQDRMATAGSDYAQQKVEYLQNVAWSDPEMADGRHPAGTATESLGNTGAWQRYYVVLTLPNPLDNLKRTIVTVNWTVGHLRAVNDTIYLRR